MIVKLVKKEFLVWNNYKKKTFQLFCFVCKRTTALPPSISWLAGETLVLKFEKKETKELFF